MKDTVVFTFGRFNPPTTGHEKLIEKVAAVARSEKADFMVFPSQSTNPKKDPLDFRTKVSYMKKMFPKYSKNIMSNKDAKSAFNIVPMLYKMGYERCIMVVGGDRVSEFETILNKYNGVSGSHGFYEFENGVEIVSAGERDENATDVSGMSASKMRAAAAANRYEDEKIGGKILQGFKSGLPSKFERTHGKKLFADLRKAMNLSEEMIEFLNSVGDDLLEFMQTDYMGYVDDATDNNLYNEIYEEFFAERKVAQDKDIEDREGTQPKKYYAKDADGDEMSKSTKQARARHFAKYGKKSDDSDSSYKPAPGDANAKTKPSKYTNLYHKMYGEDVSQKQIDDLEKFADRMLAKYDIDITFTRHFVDRMNDNRNDPEIKVAELQKFFKKIQKKKGSQIKANPDIEAVLKDMSTNLNLPVVINYKNGEFEVVHKTIMRKKNFSTSSKELKYEEVDMNIEEKLNEISNMRRLKLVSKIKNSGVVKQGSMSKDNKKEAANPAQQAAIAIAKKKSGKYDDDGNLKELTSAEKKLIDKMYDKKGNLTPLGKKVMEYGKKNEKLGKDADAGDYIDDFRKSDAPQFKGKSDEKIRQMAVAAYLKAKEKNETVDEKIATNKERMNMAALDALKKLIASKGDKQSLKSYVYTIAKSFSGVSGKDLETLYRNSIKEQVELDEERWKYKGDTNYKVGGNLRYDDKLDYKLSKADADILNKYMKQAKNDAARSKVWNMFWDSKETGNTAKGPEKAIKFAKNSIKEELDEQIEGLKKKAEKSGISYGILKKVYDRGMAAWKTGHRPGTTPQQWAFARVNSFITGGGARKSDADLWAER